MADLDAFIPQERAIQQQKTGPIGNEFLEALFSALKRIRPAARAVAANIQRVVQTNLDYTSAQTVKAAAGTVYRVRVVSTDAVNNVIVQILDNTVIRGALYCGKVGTFSSGVNGSAEAVWAADDPTSPGAGLPCATSIKIKAVNASDGTTAITTALTISIIYQ